MSRESPDNWEPSAEDLKAAEQLMRQLDADNVLPSAEHIGIEHARETVRVEDMAEQLHQLQEKLVDFYAYLTTTPPDFEYRDYLQVLHSAMQRLAAGNPGSDRERAEREYDVEQMIQKVLYNLRKGGDPVRDSFSESELRSWPGKPPRDAFADVDLPVHNAERFKLRADIFEKLCQVSDVLNEVPKAYPYRFIALRVLAAMTELTSTYGFIDRATMLGTQRHVDDNLTEALYHLRKAGGPLVSTEPRTATEDYFPPR